MEQALLDLREHLKQVASGAIRPHLAIFVYPPEWEAAMLARLPQLARECAGFCPLDLVDLGQGFLAELEGRPKFVDQLLETEPSKPARFVLQNLEQLTQDYLRRLLERPAEAPSLARLLVNSGALAAFVSYSAVAAGLPSDAPRAPTILAFPGEGDERSLNLMRLRAETNYSLARI